MRQNEPLGLGHAVLVARSLVGDEPFGVILSDDVIDANPPALKQLMDVYARVGGPVIAVEPVPIEDVSSYGVVAIDETADLGPGVFRITDLVEKPPRNEAPSNLAIIGRYVADARHLPGTRSHCERSHGRDPVDERTPSSAARPAALCVQDLRCQTRHRQQARIPEGVRVLRDCSGPTLPSRSDEYLETLPLKAGVGRQVSDDDFAVGCCCRSSVLAEVSVDPESLFFVSPCGAPDDSVPAFPFDA